MIRSIAIAAGLAVGLCSTAASAEEAYFRTPSKNISCAYSDDDGKPEVRCDIRSFTPTSGSRPADCELDWGDAFAIGARDAVGSIICHGDTVISDQAKTLGYGNVWKGNGITCMSQETGLTCTNRKGHGFSLSRKKQGIF